LRSETYYRAKPRLVTGRRPVAEDLLARAATIVLPEEEALVRQVAGEKEAES